MKRIKRLDQEATDENVLRSIHNDTAQRNQELIEFIRQIDNIDPPYSLLLNAPWGTGKSFFIRSVQLVLEQLNSKPDKKQTQESSHDEETDISNVLSNLNDLRSNYIPFYFNAWRNDFPVNPLSVLLASFADFFHKKGATLHVSSDTIYSSLAEMAKTAFSIIHIPVNLSSDKPIQNFAAQYNEYCDLRSRIDRLADKIVKSTGNNNTKLVILIDELDRCAPSFAAHLLEELKTLFQSNKILVIYSADAQALSYAMAGVYGQRYESEHFLKRFFDDQIDLAPINGYKLIDPSVQLDISSHYDQLINELLQEKCQAPRDASRISRIIDAGRNYAHSPIVPAPNGFLTNNKETLISFARSTIVPILMFIRYESNGNFQDIALHHNYGYLYTFGKQFNGFNQSLTRALEALQIDSGGIPEDSKLEFLDSLCALIYSSSSFDQDYRDARSYFANFDPEFDSDPRLDAFDRRIYTQLQFPQKYYV